jgi:vanillate O-demethylase ferredoxin subunit
MSSQRDAILRAAADRPWNNFELAEYAPHSVFIAGGIGITPVVHDPAHRRHSRFVAALLSARSERQAAFVDEIRSLGMRPNREVQMLFNDEVWQATRPCGSRAESRAVGSSLLPRAFAHAGGFQAACSERPKADVHIEHFSSRVTGPPASRFVVSLARSGKRIVVPKDKSILDPLLEAGVDVPYSCNEGI